MDKIQTNSTIGAERFSNNTFLYGPSFSFFLPLYRLFVLSSVFCLRLHKLQLSRINLHSLKPQSQTPINNIVDREKETEATQKAVLEGFL